MIAINDSLSVNWINAMMPGATKPAAPAPGESASPPPPGSTPPPPVQGVQPQVSDEDQEAKAQAAAQAVSQTLAQAGSTENNFAIRPNELRFVRDPESGKVAVQIRDAITGDEISQIPSEKMLRTMASINKTIGLLLDKQA